MDLLLSRRLHALMCLCVLYCTILGSTFAYHDSCRSVKEEEQQGHIYLEVVGRPSDLQPGHFHVLEDALVTIYASAASHACATGYRHLAGAKINQDSIPNSSDIQTFSIDFHVTGACKGCADDLSFFSVQNHRRIKSRDVEMSNKYNNRMLSSKKSPKKGKGAFYGYIKGKGKGKGSSSMKDDCCCPATPDTWVAEAFREIVYDLLRVIRIYDDGGSQNPVSPPTFPPSRQGNSFPTNSPTRRPTTNPPSRRPITQSPTKLPVTSQPTKTPSQAEETNAPTDQPSETTVTAPPTPLVLSTQAPTQSQSPSTQSETTPPTQSPSTPPSQLQESQSPSTIPSLLPSASQQEVTTAPSTAPSLGSSNNLCGPTEAPITYRSPNCDNGSQEGYQICMEFLEMPCKDAPMFDRVIAYWEGVITLNMDDHTVPETYLNQFCGPGYSPPDPVDDLYICGKVTAIDGRSLVLGTGTSVQYSDTPEPIQWGVLKLDEADLPFMQADGILYYDVVLHEIGHIIGIGNNWRQADRPLVNDACEFTGTAAAEKYRELSGCTDGLPPVECGSGHWSETCFDLELMTPTKDIQASLISDMTIASLADIGYTVDYSNANSDFAKVNLDESCKCGAERNGGFLWLWETPVLTHSKQSIGPSKELQQHAKKILSLNSPSANIDGAPGYTTTVLLRENGNMYEVTVDGSL